MATQVNPTSLHIIDQKQHKAKYSIKTKKSGRSSQIHKHAHLLTSCPLRPPRPKLTTVHHHHRRPRNPRSRRRSNRHTRRRTRLCQHPGASSQDYRGLAFFLSWPTLSIFLVPRYVCIRILIQICPNPEIQPPDSPNLQPRRHLLGSRPRNLVPPLPAPPTRQCRGAVRRRASLSPTPDGHQKRTHASSSSARQSTAGSSAARRRMRWAKWA